MKLQTARPNLQLALVHSFYALRIDQALRVGQNHMAHVQLSSVDREDGTGDPGCCGGEEEYRGVGNIGCVSGHLLYLHSPPSPIRPKGICDSGLNPFGASFSIPSVPPIGLESDPLLCA